MSDESTVERIADVICEHGWIEREGKRLFSPGASATVIAAEIDRLTAERDAARAEVERLRALRPATVEIIKEPLPTPVSSHGGPALGVWIKLMVNGREVMSEFSRVAWGTPVEDIDPPSEMVRACNALKLALPGGERDAARAEAERLREANERVGSWLSAALEDPGVCQEMKSDIEAWFAALQPTPPSWGAAGVQMTITEPEGSGKCRWPDCNCGTSPSAQEPGHD